MDRIDDLRSHANARIDSTNARIDDLRTDTSSRIDMWQGILSDRLRYLEARVRALEAGAHRAGQSAHETDAGGPMTIGLDPAPITVEEYERLAPDKVELIAGQLFGTEDDRLNTLRILLRNVGLRMAGALAPRELWLAALGIDLDRQAGAIQGKPVDARHL
jgi:hypothetical protein